MLKVRPRKTVDDFMLLGEEMHTELIEGIFFETPRGSVFHQKIVLRLLLCFQDGDRIDRLGEVILGPCDVHLPTGDIVKPDIIFVAEEHRSIIQDWIRGLPDLLIEVLSPGNIERDRLVKRDLYARNGLPEYWIVDPETRTVEVYRLDAGAYPQPVLFEAGDALTSPTLPGFSLPLSRIFPAK